MYIINKNSCIYGLDKTSLTVSEIAELLRFHENLSTIKYYYYGAYKQGGTAVIKDKNGTNISVEFHAKYNCYTEIEIK
jgi:hypothetical protein